MSVERGSGLRFALATALAVLAAGGAVIASASGAPARSAAARGGLALTPALIERTAAPGAGGTVTVANHSAEPLHVTVAVRPWRQARDGRVSPDRRRTLSGVALGATAFTLAPGAQRNVAVAARSAAALYGALEVIGLPRDADTRKGLVLGYRLVAGLRLDPAAPRLRLKAAAVRAVRGELVLPVANRGNTVVPVTGSADFKGALGTRSTSIRAMRIVPGKTVDLALSATRALPAGVYRARIVLEQGERRTTLMRNVRVRR